MKISIADYTAWLASLKVGEEVMVCGWRGEKDPLFVRKVESVTASGRVRVLVYSDGRTNVVEFGANGKARGRKYEGRFPVGSWKFYCLLPATDDLKQALNGAKQAEALDTWRRSAKQRLVSGLSWSEAHALTDEQLRAIDKILTPAPQITGPAAEMTTHLGGTFHRSTPTAAGSLSED